MRRLFAFLLVCLISIPALAQSKHPFTFEDMMKLKRVGEPVPSPDGKWVLFSVVDVNLEANTKTPHIWIVPLQPFHVGKEEKVIGGIPRNELSLQKTDSERILIADQDGTRPRWAPDGKRFAFISNKESGSQVWIADFDSAAGKVTRTFRLTKIATEADGELWSPDGKHILFVSRVYPECDGEPLKERDCNAKKLESTEKSKVKAIITERLFYRHWNAYTDGRRSHIFVIPIPALPKTGEASGTLGTTSRTDKGGRQYDDVGFAKLPVAPTDLTPGDYDAPPFSLGGQDNYAFSPDGQEIAYTSNHDKVEATSTNNDVRLVSVNGGASKNITADNPASDSTPLYSPHGKYIAYRAQQRPGYESDRFRLMLYDRKTGEKKNLTEAFDRWVGTYVWSLDSDSLFFSAEQDGNSPIFMTKFDDNGGKPSLVINGFYDDLAMVKSGLFFTKMSIDRPNEIFREELATDHNLKPAQLTTLNHDVFSRAQMSPMTSFWFPGSNGDKVQGFLVKPPNFDPDKKYPVKFLIHGGPQGAWGDDWSYRWNPELFAANGYVVIMINFHGSTGYGQKFIDEINGNWGGAPFEDLMKGLDYAEKTYPFIDKDRECALGASYGGYMTNWILGHTNRFKCIVTHDGMFNTTSAWGTTEELWFNEWEFKGTPYTNREMYDKWSPHLSATNFKTPTLVVHGQLDYRLDVSEGFQLFTTLQRQGVPSKLLYFPDEGHWVLKPQNSQLWYKTVNDWVDRWVGGGQ